MSQLTVPIGGIGQSAVVVQVGEQPLLVPAVKSWGICSLWNPSDRLSAVGVALCSCRSQHAICSRHHAIRRRHPIRWWRRCQIRFAGCRPSCRARQRKVRLLDGRNRTARRPAISNTSPSPSPTYRRSIAPRFFVSRLPITQTCGSATLGQAAKPRRKTPSWRSSGLAFVLSPHEQGAILISRCCRSQWESVCRFPARRDSSRCIAPELFKQTEAPLLPPRFFRCPRQVLPPQGNCVVPAGPALVLGPGAVPVTLLVNGKAQKLMIEPSETLATVRYATGLDSPEPRWLRSRRLRRLHRSMSPAARSRLHDPGARRGRHGWQGRAGDYHGRGLLPKGPSSTRSSRPSRKNAPVRLPHVRHADELRGAPTKRKPKASSPSLAKPMSALRLPATLSLRRLSPHHQCRPRWCQGRCQ